MPYRFHDQKLGDLLELPSGQLVIKTDKEQVLCLQGDGVGLLIPTPATAAVIRIMDREDLVSLCLDSY